MLWSVGGRRHVGWQAVTTLPEGGISSASQVDALFDKFDDDNSGTIDHGELKAMVTGLLIAMGDEVSVAEHVDHWLTEFDVDQGGTVDREEFFKVRGGGVS